MFKNLMTILHEDPVIFCMPLTQFAKYLLGQKSFEQNLLRRIHIMYSASSTVFIIIKQEGCYPYISIILCCSILLHWVDLTLCFNLAICVQLQLMFTLLLVIVTHTTYFSLIGCPQAYRLCAFCACRVVLNNEQWCSKHSKVTRVCYC
jgi:hypothetical protein